MKLIRAILLVLISFISLSTQAQEPLKHKEFNMFHLSRWDDDSLASNGIQTFNACWGWYDSIKKREYAIMGSVDSTYFIDVTDPYNPKKCDVEAGRGRFSTWRDYDTYDHYCYAVQDAGIGSLQIFDLSYLPDSVHKVYDSDSLLYRTHTIFIEGDRLYCNTVTTNFGTRRAMQILSLENPERPKLIGVLTPPIFGGAPAFNFCHDTHVRNDTAYCSGETGGVFIYDVSNPSNARLMGTIPDYPEKGYNHSSWLSEDGNTLIFVDENLGLGIKAYDVSNYANIELQSVFRSNVGAVPHNPYIKGDYLYVSYYEDGAYIFDISNPKEPKLTAFFDTYPQNNEGVYSGFYGCWSVYPFLPSGIILASDQTNGLFVLKSDVLTSTKEVGIQDFKVYPNPLSSDKLHINIFNQNEKNITVSITNAVGQKVYASQHNIESGINNIEVNIPSHLKQGIYFVTITGRISNICKKILKP